MNSKLNILFITSWFPNKQNISLGNFIKWHAEALSTHSNISIIYVAKASNLASRFNLEQENQKNLSISTMYYKEANSPFSAFNKLLNNYYHFRAYLTLFKQLKNKPDLVHANIVWPIGLFAIWLKFRYKLNFILTEHWSALAKKEKFNFLKRKLISIIFNKASLIVTVSESLKKDIQKWGNHLEPTVIPNIVNTNYFTYQEKKETDIYKWAHISTLDEVKNVDGIIRAFHKLILFDKNNHLSIISDGDYTQIKKLLSKLNFPKENISLKGTSSNTEVADLLKSSDVCVQFSKSETFGIVAAESLCTGTPILSTKVGFLKEFEESEIGLFSKNKDENDLFNKMKMMKSITFDRQKSSRKFTSLFNPKKISELYSNIYSQYS